MEKSFGILKHSRFAGFNKRDVENSLKYSLLGTKYRKKTSNSKMSRRIDKMCNNFKIATDRIFKLYKSARFKNSKVTSTLQKRQFS